jgi:adenylate cyclase
LFTTDGRDEDGTLAATIAHRTEQIESRVAEHRRRVVKTTGDGLLVEFARGVDAIMAYAVEARLAPRDRNGAGAFWESRSRKE